MNFLYPSISSVRKKSPVTKIGREKKPDIFMQKNDNLPVGYLKSDFTTNNKKSVNNY